MSKLKVTIAIPTYNRSQMIGESILSALNQDTEINYEVLILDNASTDNTEEVVKKFTDQKLRYIRNEANIGMMGNWNKAVKESQGDYLMILGDDDWLLPNFINETVAVLDNNPSVGFTFGRCNKVDSTRKILMEWGYKFTPTGFLKGIDYLFYTLDYESCLTNSTTTLIRKNVFNKVGLFKSEFGKNTFDFNMWINIASEFDVYFIDKFISDYRIHPDQVSEEHWRTSGHPTGRVGTYLELLKVLSILNGKNSKLYNNTYINTKAVKISEALTQLITKILPDL